MKNLILIFSLSLLSACVSASRYRKDVQIWNESIDAQNKINKQNTEYIARDIEATRKHLEIISIMRETIDLLKTYCESNEKRIISLEKSKKVR